MKHSWHIEHGYFDSVLCWRVRRKSDQIIVCTVHHPDPRTDAGSRPNDGGQMTDVKALADAVKVMTPAQRLVLAAGLLDCDRAELAEPIAESALNEIKWARLFPGRPLPR